MGNAPQVDRAPPPPTFSTRCGHGSVAGNTTAAQPAPPPACPWDREGQKGPGPSPAHGCQASGAPLTWMWPLCGPRWPYMHSTVADFLSIRWTLNRGLNRIGSSTCGSWGGRYIQPMMNKPSTCGEQNGHGSTQGSGGGAGTGPGPPGPPWPPRGSPTETLGARRPPGQHNQHGPPTQRPVSRRGYCLETGNGRQQHCADTKTFWESGTYVLAPRENRSMRGGRAHPAGGRDPCPAGTDASRGEGLATHRTIPPALWKQRDTPCTLIYSSRDAGAAPAPPTKTCVCTVTRRSAVRKDEILPLR